MGLSLVFSGVSFSHPNQKGSHRTSFSTETEENKICTLKRELAARRRHFLRRLSRKVEDDVGESNHIQAEKPYKSIEMWRQRQRGLAPDLLSYIDKRRWVVVGTLCRAKRSSNEARYSSFFLLFFPIFICQPISGR
jgi:hypothetical protein